MISNGPNSVVWEQTVNGMEKDDDTRKKKYSQKKKTLKFKN